MFQEEYKKAYDSVKPKKISAEELYEKIEIEKMGQKHSKALAEYLVNKCLTRINQV